MAGYLSNEHEWRYMTPRALYRVISADDTAASPVAIAAMVAATPATELDLTGLKRAAETALQLYVIQQPGQQSRIDVYADALGVTLAAAVSGATTLAAIAGDSRWCLVHSETVVGSKLLTLTNVPAARMCIASSAWSGGSDPVIVLQSHTV